MSHPTNVRIHSGRAVHVGRFDCNGVPIGTLCDYQPGHDMFWYASEPVTCKRCLRRM